MAVFLSVKELLSGAESAGLELWEYVLRASADETGISTERSWAQMAARLEAMKKADASYDAGMRSHSGLTGGDGRRWHTPQAAAGYAVSSLTAFWPRRCAWASATPACTASSQRRRRAPAESCRRYCCRMVGAMNFPEDALIKALYVASGFGAVIAQRASISGAEAGCQAG